MTSKRKPPATERRRGSEWGGQEACLQSEPVNMVWGNETKPKVAVALLFPQPLPRMGGVDWAKVVRSETATP